MAFENVVTPGGEFDEHGTFHPYSRVTEAQLQAAAAQQLADQLAAIQRGQEREQAMERARVERARAEGEAELAAYMDRAQAAYLASGGDAAGWAHGAAAKLRDEYLLERARARLTHDERKVDAMAERLKASGTYSL
jgi:hypothetical protein